MKFRTKALGMLLGAGLLVTASVFGTMAYLTDTKAVKNTFTVGNVAITLDEAKVDDMGVLETVAGGGLAKRVQENKYKIIPNHKYVKDPTVKVAEGSEKAYIRAKVTFTKYDQIKAAGVTDPSTMLKEIGNGWALSGTGVENTTDKTITYEYRYADAADSKTEIPAVFSSFNPGNLDNAATAKFAGVEINVTAEAIQADGFATAAAAWEALDNVTPTPTVTP